MHDGLKTIVCVAAAAALAGLAWFTSPRAKLGAQFSDVGEPLTPGFTDPGAARSLEVVAFDEPTATYKAFKVEHDGKRWVIPSHHNYPADAATKMAEAASAFIGITKEVVRTDAPADHEALGVLDPDDDKAPAKGRGARVTIRDASGSTLADLILGAPVPPDPAAPPQQPGERRYVRIPGKSRVYVTSLKGDVSTRFADWIETDLLQLTGANVARLEVDRSKVDERTGLQTEPERVIVTRAAPPRADAEPPPSQPAPPAPAPWIVDAQPGGPPSDSERVSVERVDGAVNAIKALKIVGVRPKPANLAKMLGGATTGEQVRVGSADILALQSRGFYLSQDGRLVANEGQVSIACDDGVVYTLWFGEVAPGTGEALSAGAAETPAPDAPPGSAAKTEGEQPDASGANRYLFITVAHDPSVVPAPPEPPAPAPAAEGETPPPDPARDAYDVKVQEREEKLKKGKDRAAALARRFADWWYVIDATAFDAMRPARADVITPAGAPTGEGAAAGPLGPTAPTTP